jgi:hypothetical protein
LTRAFTRITDASRRSIVEMVEQIARAKGRPALNLHGADPLGAKRASVRLSPFH